MFALPTMQLHFDAENKAENSRLYIIYIETLFGVLAEGGEGVRIVLYNFKGW